MAAEAIAATAAVGVEGEWAVAVEDEAVVAKRHRRGMSEALCFFFTRTIIKTIPGLRHGFYGSIWDTSFLCFHCEIIFWL